MFADDKSSYVSDSPAKEVAREQTATDRTSRMLFQLESEIKNRYKKVIVPFLVRPAAEIECLLFGETWAARPIMIPLSNRYGTYGFYLPPGLEHTMWKHPNPGFEDLVQYPRLIVAPNMGQADLVFDKDILMESLLKETEEGVYPSGIVRFTKAGLMIMLALTPSLELQTDWSDISALNSSSFAGRLAPLRHSCRELFNQPSGIVGRYAGESVYTAETMKVSARIRQ